MQRGAVTIHDSLPDVAEAWLGREYMDSVDSLVELEPPIEEVRQALSKIAGNLSDDIRAEREHRG